LISHQTLLYKRANVVAKDLDDYIFHENVMVNRGQNEKVFTDIDQAKEWLMENSATQQSRLYLATTDITQRRRDHERIIS